MGYPQALKGTITLLNLAGDMESLSSNEGQLTGIPQSREVPTVSAADWFT